MLGVCRAGLHAGPGQERYGSYFCQVLHSPQLQLRKSSIKMLRQIVFSGFDSLNYKALTTGSGLEGLAGDEDIIPFLVVYQHGHQIWGGYPSIQVGLTHNLPLSLTLTVIFASSQLLKRQ